MIISDGLRGALRHFGYAKLAAEVRGARGGDATVVTELPVAVRVIGRKVAADLVNADLVHDGLRALAYLDGSGR